MDFIQCWSTCTEIPVVVFFSWLILSSSTWYYWNQCYGKVHETQNAWIPRDYWLEEWEKQAIVDFRTKHPLEGYRSLTYMMLDRNIVAVMEHVRAEIQNQFAIQTQASYQLLERFHAQHETLKLQRRALRFDDLTRRLGQLGEAAQLKQLAFRLDASIDSLLLDEFQDTSLEQWRVMRPFAQHVAARDPHRSFLCVGDTKQAIYGWRGGNAELLQAVAEEIPDVADQQLDCSFRSSPVVIEAVNRINEGMARHDHLGRAELAVRQWCEAFPVHRTSRQELPGYVSLESHAAGTSTDDERTQAIKLAVDRVQELRGRVPQRSIAVLVRTNELVGRVIYELRSRGIAASEEGGNPLTDSAAVQLVVSLLQLADFPQDSAARYHLATSPWASTLRFENDRDEALAVRARPAPSETSWRTRATARRSRLGPISSARSRTTAKSVVWDN